MGYHAHMNPLLVLLVAMSLSGCIQYARWKETAASAELREQQVELMKDYRQCLADSSKNPQGQRDCSVYFQTRSQVDISGIK